MRVLMIAPPGAGKGTQGALIAAHFDIPHIATGELLRDHVARQTTLGQAVREYLDRGELVPDQVVLDMVREEMVAAKAAGGEFVLDGCGTAPAGRRRGTHAPVARASRARASLRRHPRRHCPAPCPLPRSDIPHCLVVPRPRNPGFRGCDAFCASGRARNPGRPRGDAPAPGPCARAGTAPR
jgi:hypothetical protein